MEKAERGTLAGSPYSSISNHTKRQDFGLEALGNRRKLTWRRGATRSVLAKLERARDRRLWKEKPGPKPKANR